MYGVYFYKTQQHLYNIEFVLFFIITFPAVSASDTWCSLQRLGTNVYTPVREGNSRVQAAQTTPIMQMGALIMQKHAIAIATLKPATAARSRP